MAISLETIVARVRRGKLFSSCPASREVRCKIGEALHSRGRSVARPKSQQRLEFEAGKCPVCDCTDEKACRMVPDPDAPIAGQKIVNCAWADNSRTLCT